MHSFIRTISFVAFLCCGSAAMADSNNPDCARTVDALKQMGDREIGQVMQGAINADAFAKAQNIDPNNKPFLVASEAIADYLIPIYVRAREDFYTTRPENMDSINIVRVFSSPDVFQKFKRSIVSLNPKSPSARLGNGGTRTVSVGTIRYLDRRLLSPGKEARRYKVDAVVDEQGRKPTQTPQLVIAVELEFTDPPPQAADRCLNPLGMRVISYQLADAL